MQISIGDTVERVYKGEGPDGGDLVERGVVYAIRGRVTVCWGKELKSGPYGSDPDDLKVVKSANERLAKLETILQKILNGNNEMSSVRGRGVAITGLSHEFIEEARAILRGE